MTQPNLRSKLRLTIGTKLVSLIAVLLLCSVVGLVWMSTRLFTDDNTSMIQQMNADTATSLATRVRENFEGITNRMRMLGMVALQESVAPEIRDRLKSEFFSKDRDFLALVIHKDADSAAPTVAVKALSPEMSALGDADGEKLLSTLAAEKDYSLGRVARGEPILAPVRLQDGSPALAVSIPFIAAEGAKGRFTHTLTAFVRQTKFAKAFSESEAVTSYLVDHKGRLLAHPDATRAAAGESLAQQEIVRMMLEGKVNNAQTRYQDPQSGEWRLGAFHLVGFAALGVVSEVPEAKALEAAQDVKRKSTYIAIIILCIAFLTGYLYSGTITRPIKQLVEAARRIAAGDFAIDLKPRSRDEIATLSVAFNDMAKGLEERDRVKETFNKFHNKEIAEKLLSGEVKLGGERKEATIFFSDVRGFTAMSETMEPEQVVEMLNEYMTRMVSIIRAHHGIVDKYVGDAIMAIWGVPLPGEDDMANAVKACLAMRAELDKLNELRLSRGQNALKIGMGLNTGSVIAGNIGSDEKMEYTVIGDSVNLASRMESMTKEYGTDFLIPKVIQERLEGRFVFEKCRSAKVKGKSQAIEIFKVRGYIDENGQEVIIETPYSSYESEKSDKVVHDEPAAAAHAEAASAAAPVAPAEPVAPDEPAGDEWFVQLGTDALGPFTEKEICDALAKGEFTPETRISPSRLGPFIALSQSPAFSGGEDQPEAPAAIELQALPLATLPEPDLEAEVEVVAESQSLPVPPPFTAPPPFTPQANVPVPPPFRGPAAEPASESPTLTQETRRTRRRRGPKTISGPATPAPLETATPLEVSSAETVQPLEILEVTDKKAA